MAACTGRFAGCRKGSWRRAGAKAVFILAKVTSGFLAHDDREVVQAVVVQQGNISREVALAVVEVHERVREKDPGVEPCDPHRNRLKAC